MNRNRRWSKRCVGKTLRRLCLAGLISVPAAGQALLLAPAAGEPGDYVTLEIAWKAPPESPAVALQWELAIPSRNLELLKDHLARELLTVQQAGKSLACSVLGSQTEDQTVRCILSGGPKAIPAGTIVLVPLRISPGAQPGSLRIRLDHSFGVLSDLKQIAIAPTVTMVTVKTH